MRVFLCSCFLIAALGLAACETTLDIELPSDTPVLVVNSLFRAGESWRVEVSRSVGSGERGDYEPPTVRDATVEVWTDGTLLETLRFVSDGTTFGDRAAYVGDTAPEPGKTYTLKARAHGFEKVEATTTVPPVPAAPHVQVLGSPSEYQTELRVRVTDLPGDTYFALSVERSYEGGNGEAQHIRMSFTATDPVFRRTFVDDFDSGDGSYFNIGYFTDTLLRDGAREITIRVEDGGYYPDPSDRRAYRVALSAVSKGYYDYTGTRTLQSQSRDNPFAEKVDVYSNVQGGLGIFAGASTAVARLQ